MDVEASEDSKENAAGFGSRTEWVRSDEKSADFRAESSREPSETPTSSHARKDALGEKQKTKQETHRARRSCRGACSRASLRLARSLFAMFLHFSHLVTLSFDLSFVLYPAGTQLLPSGPMAAFDPVAETGFKILPRRCEKSRERLRCDTEKHEGEFR